ncbi:amino acid transporter AVT1I-like [Phragmites australis]|uniref:amino acid transporter AVT1I-like n=1 Tax=Phragmites australis TaxID=29695 RepID=UPI002D79DC6B|nr:amino acid transporter AVT1I-like [Phragmites australis]
MAAAQESPLDKPFLVPGKDEEQQHGGDDGDVTNMEAQLLLPRDSGASSFSRSCLNLSNVISGVGMLSVPYALAQGGWLSLALFALVGAVCYYTGELIARCMRADGDAVKSYPDIGQLAFGRPGRKAIGAVMYAELYLVAISFLILEGDSLNKLLPGASVGLPGGYVFRGKQLFTLVAAVVILPTTWLRDLSVLAYVSAVGLVSSAALTASLVWAGVAEHGLHAKGGNVVNLAGLPTSLSLYFVCFAGHGVFPTVYSSMRNKGDFTKVLLVSSVLCSLNYALTAVLGYLIYGDDVQSLVTLNLPSGKVYTRIAILTTLITPLAKYALVIQPVTTAIEEKLSLAGQRCLTRAVISTTVLVSTVVVACTVPFFGYLMSFIGSSLNVTVAVLFPCLSYLRIYMPRGGVRRAEVAAIVGILVIGACVAVVGTYTSLHQIVSTF